jgi:hypothetical protein
VKPSAKRPTSTFSALAPSDITMSSAMKVAISAPKPPKPA